MATDFIKIQREVATATFAHELLNFVSVLNDAYMRGRHLREVMRHNFTGTDFTQLEALFGVPASSGQEVFTLVDGAIGAMEGLFQVAAARDLTERVG